VSHAPTIEYARLSIRAYSQSNFIDKPVRRKLTPGRAFSRLENRLVLGNEMRSHEYVLLDGISRAKIGRYLGTAAAAISAGIVYLVLRAVDLAGQYGLPENLTPSIMSLIGAGTVYLVLYWIFDRHIWRLPWMGKFLKVPDLQGEWSCDGISYSGENDQSAREWAGTISIVQSWDRLRIRLTTHQSGSDSVVAAVMHDEAGGYRLFYNYRNDSHIDQHELDSHVGFCDMTVSADQKRAEGDYFNGRGRTTYGRMNWSRRA
jgi:SMODS-associating 2TM, beta-strand rich effector domain